MFFNHKSIRRKVLIFRIMVVYGKFLINVYGFKDAAVILSDCVIWVATSKASTEKIHMFFKSNIISIQWQSFTINVKKNHSISTCPIFLNSVKISRSIIYNQSMDNSYNWTSLFLRLSYFSLFNVKRTHKNRWSHMGWKTHALP